MRSILRRALKGLLVASILVLAVTLIERTTLFSDLDRLTFDVMIDHVGLSAPSLQIVVVDFDEETFQRIRQYPIPRSDFAKVIQQISAGRPRVIGLDILLSEPRNLTEDKAMQDALTESGVVILASKAAVGLVPAVSPLPQFCQPEDPAAPSGFCKEGAPGALGYASVNMPIDDDGFVRQADLFLAGEPPGISFPLTLAQQFAGQSIQPGDRNYAVFLGHKVPYSNADLKTFRIGSWGREPGLIVPAWKLLAGQVPPQTFTDKLVLIGQTSSASSDTHLTPLFRMSGPNGVRLNMGGTMIHASAIRTLLEGRTVRLPSLGVFLLCMLVICTVAATLLLSCELNVGLIGLIAVMLVVHGLTWLLYARWRLWMPWLPMETGLVLALPVTLGVRFLEERVISREANKQRSQLMGLFSSYVDPAIAETIWQRRSELSLGGEEHTATVMFTDIRGFTALSSNQPPAVVLGWLNQYVVAMDEVIRAHGGFLNKFIGDGLMIVFGLPLGRGPREDARRALEAALAMLERVEQLNTHRSAHPEFPHLRIGIGIHTGSLVAGSIGSANRQEYSVIGETVNLASRLESLNKTFGTQILMTAATMLLVADLFPGIEPLGEAKVAGLQEPVPVYTLRVAAIDGQDVTVPGAKR
jgi:class 3 adenylate cyclase/CHASE2 domain-containing sensor protein